jgi:hypothetical protein
LTPYPNPGSLNAWSWVLRICIQNIWFKQYLFLQNFIKKMQNFHKKYAKLLLNQEESGHFEKVQVSLPHKDRKILQISMLPAACKKSKVMITAFSHFHSIVRNIFAVKMRKH